MQMTTLHIFNPEHDIALAFHLANFTAPHAARQLRADLGFLPALWAKPEDGVLVDHVDYSRQAFTRVSQRLHKVMGIEAPLPAFVAWRDRQPLSRMQSVAPWGWDLALRASLRRRGVQEQLLPTDSAIAEIRQLSHRRTSAALLPCLRMENTVGESFECRDEHEVISLLQRYRHVVLKAPWSSSGRGLRFLSVERTPFAQQQGWFRNLLAQQGSVMVEPYYNKVCDFGMEFQCDASGSVRYVGLSLFHTVHGAYTGNILATEHAKQLIMERYVPTSLLHRVADTICQRMEPMLKDRYRGPFGVDMMVVARGDDAGGFLLHPCVEINLRRTMGHVAIALSPTDDDVAGLMHIETGDHYKLKISKFTVNS